MVDENDKSLFRSTVEHQKPIDKDAVQSIDASKSKSKMPFQTYSFLYEPNISGS